MLRMRFHPPAPALGRFVRFYVQRDVHIRGIVIPHPVPARAASMIEFDFGDQVDVLYDGSAIAVKSHAAVVVGPQTYRRVEMRLTGALQSFVIMFQPDGLHRLFGIPMHLLTDADGDAHSVLGAFISTVREQLGNAGSLEERVRIVDQILLRHSQQSPEFDSVSAAASQIIQSGGRVAIPHLANQSGLSSRQFERRFIDQVGMRPKLFARIARFEAALETKARFAQKSWTNVAHDFGYYDQMHMIHDFAEFAGGTPTQTLRELETVFVEQIRHIRSGARAALRQADPRLIL
jgi:AraC-like DNA-binding protein